MEAIALQYALASVRIGFWIVTFIALFKSRGTWISILVPFVAFIPMFAFCFSGIIFLIILKKYCASWFVNGFGSLYRKHRSYTVILDPKGALNTNLEHIGRAIKAELNSLNQADFRRVRTWQVVYDKQPDEVSRGYSRLREIFTRIGAPHNLGRVIELGVGRGGWLQYIDQKHTFDSYHGYSLWKQDGQEKLMYSPKQMKKCELHSSDVTNIVSSDCDTLLIDMGENNDQYEQEVAHTIKLLNNAGRWLKHRPVRFAIRVPNAINDEVLNRLYSLQEHQRDGQLIRLDEERNSVATTYFCSGKTTDLRGQVDSLVDLLCDRIHDGLENAIEVPVPKRDQKMTATWPTIGDLPVPKLVKYDMSETIKAHGKLEKPKNITSFLKEIGWKPSGFTGNVTTYYNSVVTKAIGPLKGLLPGYGLWRTTSTAPDDTYITIKNKIDHAPCENHKHHDRIWQCYEGIAKYIKMRGLKMHKLNDYEVMCSVNPLGAMGWQDHELGFTSMGDYIKYPEIWKPREQMFATSLKKNKPIHGDYNSIGKRERKQKKSSRLIWFLSATARIHETRILAGIDSILKYMPFSVSGLPLYDYGVALSHIMGEGKVAVCDDIAGWDTKVSYSLLCMENAFLRQLAENEEHADEITRLYRLYAYPLVNITRPDRDAKNKCESVLCALQGQVASGRRVTYAMNTFTNAAITMARASLSQDISVDTLSNWVFNTLKKGHTDEYGGKISGDDSVIVMSPENAIKYANQGAWFMNEIGFPRKDVDAHSPSRIIDNLCEVEFCSHRYTRVLFKNGPERWMPIRDVGEIVAKASIMVRSKFGEANIAWARAQALNMFVNYFHIPTVRMLAQTILSMTPDNITLDGSDEGWSYRIKPWIQPGDPLDIINGCLFGDSTKYPLDFRIKSTKDLPYINQSARNIFDVNFKTLTFKTWKHNLYPMVTKAEYQGEHYKCWVYDYGPPADKAI